jgi:hypothetical protein
VGGAERDCNLKINRRRRAHTLPIVFPALSTAHPRLDVHSLDDAGISRGRGFRDIAADESSQPTSFKHAFPNDTSVRQSRSASTGVVPALPSIRRTTGSAHTEHVLTPEPPHAENTAHHHRRRRPFSDRRVRHLPHHLGRRSGRRRHLASGTVEATQAELGFQVSGRLETSRSAKATRSPPVQHAREPRAVGAHRQRDSRARTGRRAHGRPRPSCSLARGGKRSRTLAP